MTRACRCAVVTAPTGIGVSVAMVSLLNAVSRPTAHGGAANGLGASPVDGNAAIGASAGLPPLPPTSGGSGGGSPGADSPGGEGEQGESAPAPPLATLIVVEPTALVRWEAALATWAPQLTVAVIKGRRNAGECQPKSQDLKGNTHTHRRRLGNQ